MNQKPEQVFNNDELIEQLRGGRSVEFAGKFALDIYTLSRRAERDFSSQTDFEQPELNPTVRLLFDEVVSRIHGENANSIWVERGLCNLVEQWASTLQQRLLQRQRGLKKMLADLRDSQDNTPAENRQRGHAGLIRPNDGALDVHFGAGLAEAGYLTRCVEFLEPENTSEWKLPRWIGLQRAMSRQKSAAASYVRLLQQIIGFTGESDRRFGRQYTAAILATPNLWWLEPVKETLLSRGMYPIEVKSALPIKALYDDHWWYDRALNSRDDHSLFGELRHDPLRFHEEDDDDSNQQRRLVQLATFDHGKLFEHVKRLRIPFNENQASNWTNELQQFFHYHNLRPPSLRELDALITQYPKTDELLRIAAQLSTDFVFGPNLQYTIRNQDNVFVQPFLHESDLHGHRLTRVYVPNSDDEGSAAPSLHCKRFLEQTWFAAVVRDPDEKV